jgi:hypothetical protein
MAIDTRHTADMTMPTASTPATAQTTGFPDDQLYMLKLCLELQLEALLLALGSSAVASRSGLAGGSVVPGTPAGPGLPWSRWLSEDLELACSLTKDCVDDDIPLPSSIGLPAGGGPQGGVEALAARYTAMAAVVGEMLDRTDPVRHPMAVARLVQTRQRCEERLDELLGPPASLTGGDRRVSFEGEAGHYLG